MNTQTHDAAASQAALSFHLETFEALVHTGGAEAAARELLRLLSMLDEHYSLWGESFQAHAPVTAPERLNPHICTRLAGAITTLFCKPGFGISDDGFVAMMDYHRWLSLIFAVSSYGHGDHIIRTLNAAGSGVVDPLRLNGENLRLFCLSY